MATMSTISSTTKYTRTTIIDPAIIFVEALTMWGATITLALAHKVSPDHWREKWDRVQFEPRISQDNQGAYDSMRDCELVMEIFPHRLLQRFGNVELCT